jgi:DNA-binding NarL/FixJ family response regulator
MPRKQHTLGIAEDMQVDQYLTEHFTKSIKNTKIIFRSGNGLDVLFKLNHFKPDIVLHDMYMPFLDGIHVVKTLNKLNYKGNIICVCSVYEPEKKQELIALGVKGFVPKHRNHLCKAIAEVIKGRTYFNDVLGKNDDCITTPPIQEKVNLTGQEIAIINKLAEGKESKTIAEELGGLSGNSIDTYIKNILHKLNCVNRPQLIHFAHSYGLIYTFESLKHLPKPNRK